MHYGCTVIWAVRNLEKAQKALDKLDSGEGTHTCEDGHVHRCCGKTTGKAILLQVDISDLTTVKPFVTDFLELGLPLHFLILNAMHHPRGKTPAPSLALSFHPPTSRSPSRPSARASRRGPRRPCSARSARTSPSTRATDTSSTSTEALREGVEDVECRAL
mmetsp:Transcript_20819/g.61518  ORF Transcript_20819/g.61518 Transcript_20819/m.61518 type:complete len:161 (+) Transcript_20819:256-738(+)